MGLKPGESFCRPSNQQKEEGPIGLLSQLLSKSYWTSTKDFQSKLQDWGEAVRECEKTSGRPFGEEFKVATTLKYAPPEIRTHLLMRVTDRTTYEELRGLVMDYLRANQAWSTPQDDGDAMDVSLVKGKGKFEGERSNCGKKGHKSMDCWAKGGGKAGKSNGKGKKGEWGDRRKGSRRRSR